jgi:hypothetical protein
VRLFEHPDFDQVILQAAEHFQLRPGIIEKDYYVTEVLRIIAATGGDKVIFKAGTSQGKFYDRHAKPIEKDVALCQNRHGPELNPGNETHTRSLSRTNALNELGISL